jgi:hypothetical protein
MPVPPGSVWHLRSCLGWPDAPVKTLAGSLVRQPEVLRLTVVQNRVGSVDRGRCRRGLAGRLREKVGWW